jgi:hypothetical protein
MITKLFRTSMLHIYFSIQVSKYVVNGDEILAMHNNLGFKVWTIMTWDSFQSLISLVKLECLGEILNCFEFDLSFLMWREFHHIVNLVLMFLKKLFMFFHRCSCLVDEGDGQLIRFVCIVWCHGH